MNETRPEIQRAVAGEIENALREMSPGYFRRTRGECYVSPDGEMSWQDQTGRQVVVKVFVA